MVGAGTIIIQKAGAKTQAAARIYNSAIASSSAAVRLLVGQMTDRGIIKDDHGPSTCTNRDCGHVIGPNDFTCPRCGTEVGVSVWGAVDSPDEEMLRDEEKPIHSPGEEIYTEITVPLDLPECLQEGLLELGWEVDDAEEGGLMLANIWPGVGPTDEGEYKEGLATLDNPLKKRFLEPETLSRMLRQFQHYHDEKSETTQSVQAELRIFKEDGEWMVEVDDPLRDKVATGRKGTLQVGDFKMSEERMLKILHDRAKRLPKLGIKLVHYRKDFFEAKNVDDAEKVLETKGCTQKAVAKAAGIPRSTLCRWCDENTGVWVDTPHGVHHLKDFFGKKVKGFRGEDLNKATVLGLILDARRDLMEKGHDDPAPGDVVKWLENNEHKFDMEPRTQSWYFLQAKTMEKVIEAKGSLSNEQQEPLSDKGEQQVHDKILDILKKDFNIDINNEGLQHYLDMIQIYEDHGKE